MRPHHRLCWSQVHRYLGVRLEELSYPRARLLLQALGWLARWWIHPDLLRLIAREQPGYHHLLTPPALPTPPGGCWVVLTRNEDVPALRSAFLVPLSWRCNTPDDPHLPPALARLARCVRQQVLTHTEPGWGLHLARPPGELPVDLSGLDDATLGADSAWGALLGGLLLGRDGLASSPRVWISAAWDDTYGIGPVAGVAAKLDLAVAWSVEQFYLPAQNQAEVASWRAQSQEHLPITLLAPASSGARGTRLLESYLENLGVAPDEQSSWEARVRYYRRVGRKRAGEFAWRMLQAAIVRQCRQELPSDCHPTHLVTVVSKEVSVVALAPEVFQVRQCLLLCVGQPAAEVQQVLDVVSAHLQGAGIASQVVCILGERYTDQLRCTERAMHAFLDGVSPDQVAFDLTPGPKPMTLALEAVAPTGAWLLYCRHRTGPPDGRPEPFSQNFDCWRKGDSLPRCP